MSFMRKLLHELDRGFESMAFEYQRQLIFDIHRGMIAIMMPQINFVFTTACYTDMFINL